MSDRGKVKASHDARHHKSSNFVDDDRHSDRMDIIGEGPSSHSVDDEFEYPDIDEHHLFDDEAVDEPIDDPINDVAEGNGVPVQGVGVTEPSHPWKLLKPAPGGPKIINMIPSFGSHIVFDIWMGKSRGVLKCQSPTDRDSLELLEQSGLYQLKDCTFAHHNSALISAFVERWQPDTNTFHMPFGEMSITLHDVSYIMGLHIDGKLPLAIGDRENAIRAASCCLSAPLSKVREWFGNKGPTYGEVVALYKDNDSAETRARRYILYLIGSTLIVDKSGGMFKPTYNPLIEDISKVDWVPFGVNVSLDVPKIIYHGKIRWLEIVEPYMPDRFLRQFGWKQIVIPASPLPPTAKTKRGRKHITYRVIYDREDENWDVPSVHELDYNHYGVDAVPAFQVAEEYMDWYLERTHPRVHPGDDRMQKRPPNPVPAIFNITRLAHPYFLDRPIRYS
ncbi:hypothetical protein MIMGU_mgv1a027055mg [Erythranthe guttata]|uniref:Aminotransferase-like plant mobile domain-containing protein n=1 Tax=Erythranthe guttata TaxID=4155 RepID=A0A022RYB7_ERYGU|nr:hypothetical protein MIMGU_mgv1a027055mg [Erythranthe guttata]